jgi:hypothetical protein
MENREMNILADLENTVALSLSENWSRLYSVVNDSFISSRYPGNPFSDDSFAFDELPCLVISSGLLNSLRN